MCERRIPYEDRGQDATQIGENADKDQHVTSISLEGVCVAIAYTKRNASEKELWLGGMQTLKESPGGGTRCKGGTWRSTTRSAYSSKLMREPSPAQARIQRTDASIPMICIHQELACKAK